MIPLRKKSYTPNDAKKRQLNRDSILMYAFLAPSAIVVILMTVVPLAYSFYLSFFNYLLIRPQERFFTGFNNYIQIFSNRVLRTAVTNTLVYTFSTVIASVILGLIIALIVHQLTKGKTFFRIAMFSPMMLSPVVVGIVLKFILNNHTGIVAYFLSLFGLSSPNWFGNPDLAMFSVVMVDVWQWTSYVFIICLAGLESINMEPVESARIDGANSLQVFRHITFPTILPLIQVAAIFRFIWAFRGFDSIFALTRGGPGIATETMAMSIWRQAFQQFNIGVASSMSVLMFSILMILAMFILRKTFRDEGAS